MQAAPSLKTLWAARLSVFWLIGGEESNLAVADLNFIALAGLVIGPPIVGIVAQTLSLGVCMLGLAVLWGLCGWGLVQRLSRGGLQPAA